MGVTNLPYKKTSRSGWQTIIPSLVLGLALLSWTLDSFLNPVITSTDLNMSATIVSKDLDPTLYPRDNLFADETLYQFYTPLYRWIIAQTWQWSGSFEAGLIWLVPPILGLYVAGMFILLRYVTGNNWIALALTIASAHYHNTMGAGVWGVGGSAEMMPRALFMPVVPLIALIGLRVLAYKPSWGYAALVGLIIGLATNVHPVSGFHVLMILAASLILRHGQQSRGWGATIIMGVLAGVGAWPVVANYAQNSGQAVSKIVQFDQFSRIVAERYPVYFFPDTLYWPLFDTEISRPVLDGLVWFYLGLSIVALVGYVWGRYRWPGLIRWSLLVGGLVTTAYAYLMVLFDNTLLFVLVAFYIVYCFRQKNYPQPTAWFITLAGVIVLYAFVGYYLLTLVWQIFEVWPLTSLIIEYARAARFVYLPIYLLAGLAGVALVEEVKRLSFLRLERYELQTSLVIAIILGIGPTLFRHFADNLLMSLLGLVVLVLLTLVAVWGIGRFNSPWSTVSAMLVFILCLFGPPASLAADYLPIPARNLLQADSLVAVPVSPQTDIDLYEWTLENTPTTALFYGCFGSETMTYFRRKTQRSITHNWKDLAYNVHNRATLLSAYSRFRQLETDCRTLNSVLERGHALQADYLLLPGQEAVDFLAEACFSNEKYAVFTLNPKGCHTN